MTKIYAINATISDFTNGMKKLAKKDADFSKCLVNEFGLTGDIDDKFVRKVLPNHFTKEGNLSENGKKNLLINIKDFFGLNPKDSVPADKRTLDEFFNKLLEPKSLNFDDFSKK